MTWKGGRATEGALNDWIKFGSNKIYRPSLYILQPGKTVLRQSFLPLFLLLFPLFLLLFPPLLTLSLKADPLQVVASIMLPPVSQIPAKFGLVGYVYPSHAKLVSNLSEGVDADGLYEFLSEVDVGIQSGEEYFEEVGSDAGIGGAFVLLGEL